MKIRDNCLCNFCGMISPALDNNTYIIRLYSFEQDFNAGIENTNRILNNRTYPDDTLALEQFLCPNCRIVSVSITGVGDQFKDRTVWFHPLSTAMQYPEYIPESIRMDYEEAYAILNLSPKASATLTRRCLQSMIRDFWKIKPDKLNNEIYSIADKVDPDVKNVLDALRQMGNIGAHPEKDINTIVEIEPGEAEKMIKIIEYLMDEWYIKRHKTEVLLNEVCEINNEKQSQRIDAK